MLNKIRIGFFSLLLFSNLLISGCGGEGSESLVEAQGTEEASGTKETSGTENTVNKGQVDDAVLIRLINQLND